MNDPRDILVMWTIYWSPTDYPHRFVVRGFDITASGPVPHAGPVGVVRSLEEARALIPQGCMCMTRSDDDEPQIVESWL